MAFPFNAKVTHFFSFRKAMAQNKVEFTINIGGNAYDGVATLDAAMGKLNITSTKTTSLFEKVGVYTLRLNNIFQLATSAVSTVANAFAACAQASNCLT